MKLAVLAAIAGLLPLTPAVSAECLLGKAIYAQEESDWQVKFEPVPEANAGGSFTNKLTIPVPGSDFILDGEINWPNGYSQPFGQLMLNCGDEGETPESCSIWEGVVYELRDGKLSYIVSESVAAPQQILFPDLSGTLWYSKLRYIYDVETVPWDVFTLKGCAE